MDCLDFLSDAMTFTWEEEKKSNQKPQGKYAEKPFQNTVARQAYVNRNEKNNLEEDI